MGTAETDKTFDGSIPKLYETYMVPLFIFNVWDRIAERLSRGASDDRLWIAKFRRTS
jgi:hypothetical protein